MVLRRATTGTVASDRRVGVEVGVGVDGGEAQRLELSRGEREREWSWFDKNCKKRQRDGVFFSFFVSD